MVADTADGMKADRSLPGRFLVARRATSRHRAVVLGKPGRELTTIAWRISRGRARKNPWVACIALAAGAAVALILGLAPGVNQVPGYIRGLGAGIVLAVGMAYTAWLMLISDGSMTWRVGALGEFWTSEELRKLGPGWTILNSLKVPAADGTRREIDHVAVGPGGVIAVETKLWPAKASVMSHTGPDLSQAAVAARRHRDVLCWYLSSLIGPDAVESAAVIWGSDLLSPADRVLTHRNGTAIVHGRDAQIWVSGHRAVRRLTPETSAAVIERLRGCMVDPQRLRDTKAPTGWTRPRSR